MHVFNRLTHSKALKKEFSHLKSFYYDLVHELTVETVLDIAHKRFLFFADLKWKELVEGTRLGPCEYASKI